jgi:hypothetical protein
VYFLLEASPQELICGVKYLFGRPLIVPLPLPETLLHTHFCVPHRLLKNKLRLYVINERPFMAANLLD